MDIEFWLLIVGGLLVVIFQPQVEETPNNEVIIHPAYNFPQGAVFAREFQVADEKLTKMEGRIFGSITNGSG